MRKIILIQKEYQYIMDVLLKNNKETIDKIKICVDMGDTVEIELDDDTAYDIWQLADDNVALHFDENYEPTEEGWILEHLLDKFYK